MCKAIEKEGLQGGENDKSRVIRYRHIHDPGIQQEPCLKPVLLASGWCHPPPRKALPLRPRSYGLMRQITPLHQDFVSPLIPGGLCRLLQPLLGDGPSRRSSASLSPDAWAMIPA